MTNCTQVELWLAAREADTLTPDDDESLRRHLNQCSTCRELAGFGESEGFGSLEVVPEHRYRIGRELARGGMGRIREAEDVRLGRQVAIKELLTEESTALKLRFEREAMITARLQHPAIVPVYEAGKWPNGKPFYAMKRVKGRSLYDVIGDTKDIADRLALLPNVIAIAEAVAFAHARGVVHRDLKPDNVLVGDYGETVVIDWGLAKDLTKGEGDDDIHVGPYREKDAQLTRAGAVIGTPAYMPPEQARGESVDARADVYSLGAMLYHVLVGDPPYRGTGDQVLAEVLDEAPPPLAAEAPGTPPDLLTIVEKAMSRDAAARYADAGELADDLRKFQTGQLVGAHAYSRGELFSRWLSRNKRPVAVAAVATLALLAGAGVSFARIASERDQAQASEAAAQASEAAAQVAQRKSEDTASKLLVEQGRRELLDGRPEHAAVYLSAAYSAGVDTPALRFLLAEALRPLRAIRGVIDRTISDPTAAVMSEISADGKLASLPTTTGLVVWDLEAGEPVLEVPGAEFRVAHLTADASHVVGVSPAGVGKWNLATGERVLSYSRPEGIRVGGLSLDNRWIMVQSASALALVDASTGREVASRPLDGQPVGMIGSVDASIFVNFLGDSKTAMIWSIPELELLAKIPGVEAGPPSRGSLSSPLSADGQRIALATQDGAVAVFRTRTGGVVWKQAEQDRPLSAVFSPDGKHVLTSGGKRATVRDATTGELVCTMDVSGTPAVGRYGMGGAIINVTLASEYTTLVFDAQTCLLIDRSQGWLLGRTDDGLALRVRYDRMELVSQQELARVANLPPDGWLRFPDDDHVSTTGAPGVSLFDARTGTRVGQLPEARTGENTTVVAHTTDGEIAITDLATGARLGTIAAKVARNAIVVEQFGRGVAVVEADGRIATYRADGTPIGRTATPLTGHRLAYVGDRLITFGGAGAAMWSDAGKRLGDLGPPDRQPDRQIDYAALNEDGTRALAIDSSGTLSIHDATDGRPIARLGQVVPGVGALGVTVSPDGTLVSNGHEVWSWQTGERVTTLERVAGFGYGARFAGGSHIVRPGLNSQSGIWSAATGKLEQVFSDLQGARFMVVGVADSGDFVAVASTGEEIELRDRRTGALLKRFPVPGDSLVTSAAGWQMAYARAEFSPDESRMAIIGGQAQRRQRTQPIVLWRTEREAASPDEVAALVDQYVPVRLDEGRLVPKQAPPAPAAKLDPSFDDMSTAELLSCDRLGEVRSLDNAVPATLDVINKSDEVIRYLWINFKGEVTALPHADRPPHSRFRGNTWTSHPFMIQRADGSCVHIIRAKEGGSRYVYLGDDRPGRDAAPSGEPAVSVTAEPAAPSERLACDRLSSLRSTDDGKPTEITFINDTDADVFTRFLERDGSILKRDFDRVPAGGEQRQTTMSSHYFVVEDAAGGCIEIVRALDSPSRYVHGESP